MSIDAGPVLMFGWEYPPAITGGLGTACRGLVTALAELGLRIFFVAPRLTSAPQPCGLNMINANDVEVPLEALNVSSAGQGSVALVAVDSALTPYANADSYLRSAAGHVPWSASDFTADSVRFDFTGGYGRSLFEEVARYADVASVLAGRLDFALIHAHDWMTFPAAFAAKARSGKPVVAHFHALEEDRCGGYGADERVLAIERHAVANADLIVAVSNRTAKMLTTSYGAAPGKIRVVHNGVEQPPPRVPARRSRHLGKLVTFLGRLTLQKGPDYFLEAAFLIARHRPDARFVMAGSGDMRPQLIERMAALGLTGRFHFAGFVDERRRAELLEETDCFIMPSVSEPFGLTPVEALQYGVPVVISKQSGVAEVLRGSIKVDFWDVRRLADVVLNILAHEPLARQLSEDGRRDANELTWLTAAKRVTAAYSEIQS